MAAAMLFAVALVGAVAWLFVRGAEPVDKVSPHWLDTFTRDRRDQ
jgi:flagellar biogenesis protein FliO